MDRHFGVLEPDLRTSADIISMLLDPKDVLLGGGTVLSSRWGHRLSTDLDFFTHKGMYQISQKAEFILEDLHRDGVITDPIVLGSGVLFRVGETPVSLFGAAQYTEDAPSEKSITCGIYLEETTEILIKKIVERIHRDGVFELRDLYDFCVCAIKDAPALNRCLDFLPREVRRNIGKEIEERGKVPRDASKKQIIDPTYPEISENVWECTGTLFADEKSHHLITKHQKQDLPPP